MFQWEKPEYHNMIVHINCKTSYCTADDLQYIKAHAKTAPSITAAI